MERRPLTSDSPDPVFIADLRTPVLVGLITKLRIDLVQFDGVFTLNMMIGLLTLPIGIVIYV